MAINSFKIIALKAVRPRLDEFPENNARHYEKVEAIQTNGFIFTRELLYLRITLRWK